MLLEDEAEVHALVRSPAECCAIFGGARNIHFHGADLSRADFDIEALLGSVRPDYLFNLAGQSSVRESISVPRLSWSVNADWTARLLEAVRTYSPETRLYQASSSEMFGNGEGVHDEHAPLNPVTPYAASKAAAHLLCRAYREAYRLRIACGISFNHESKYRSSAFLTAKVAAHVRSLQSSHGAVSPIRVGNLETRRDWGYAAEFANGILLIAAQIEVRSRRDSAATDAVGDYRDYVLATGSLTSVRQLIDRAFTLGGFELDWDMNGGGHGKAYFRSTRSVAVESAPEFFRPGEPAAIAGNPNRALRELGWQATKSVDLFLSEMVAMPSAQLNR